MPVAPTYPGVYIQEIPSGVRTITGVATSITAFLGRALRGPVNIPVRIQSLGEFERAFGGLWINSTLSFAVQHYFLNGGGDALIVRLGTATAATASFRLAAGPDELILDAASPGSWADDLRIDVDHDTRELSDAEKDKVFNLTVREVDETDATVQVEIFRNVSVDAAAPRFVGKVLQTGSALMRLRPIDPSPLPNRPDEGTDLMPASVGGDGGELGPSDYEGSQNQKTGLFALDQADLFNLLCIPPPTREEDLASSTWTAALAYCKKRRALLLVDPPSGWKQPSQVTDAGTGVDSLNLRDENAALFFPRVRMPDPLQENRLEEFPPSGAVAGVFARTDAQRGVWKAPAGTEATLRGVQELAVKLTDGENGQLNPLGVNCLRTFPVFGHVVWGARTLEGADRLASEWKYIPVRRLALFIEESLYRGTQWAVFEPNDEPLWAQLRLNIGSFMQSLFVQGAFQGQTRREAYLVKVDSETTTQVDKDRGIVNIMVGFAPLKPAEFVIIRIQQLAGQTEA